MYKSRWGFHPCAFEEFRELRDLWRAVLIRRRQVAAWRRWNARAPHNRVKRPRIRDSEGRVVGYALGVPMPEPPLPELACRKVTRPSGKAEVVFAGPAGKDLRRLQEAYRIARRSRPTAAEVELLPVTLDDVRQWQAAIRT
jgi:hypothetical protein